MKVEQILSFKGSDTVYSIAPDSSVTEAVARLTANKIGALVVGSEPGRVEGILSERDIVRHLGEIGPSALDAKVSEIMTSDVVGCRAGESANSVLERMTAGRFRHMPVMEGDRMIGLLSIGDVVKARIEDIERENAAMAEMLRG